jgi:NAD(P)-dependent dehydrogenase (short-subunit alcohol dehydrogenase family)
MARVFITGSAGGLGRLAAASLLDAGHDVVVHARDRTRAADLANLVDRGATSVIGDLSDSDQVHDVAEQVNALPPLDALIHNAGVLDGKALLPVNVVAPYLLTTLIASPRRLVHLSSSMHTGGNPVLDGLDWRGRRPSASYSTSKLLLTTLSAALARLQPDQLVNAVDPGWVPTRMGGRGAPDDLALGHRTQEWLAVGDESRALTTGGYWYHQQRRAPHPAAQDERFQDALIARLGDATGVSMPSASTDVTTADCRVRRRDGRTNG